MDKFKVGDVIESINSKGSYTCEVMSASSNGLYSLKVITHSQPTIIGYSFFQDNETVDRIFEVVTPTNPNHVMVSSLDYMTSTTLTKEDKDIIKGYLYENS